jgi:DNA processing protein
MTVVVEAAERSGSLITAEVAADLGRDVGRVPGPVHVVAREGHERAAARRRGARPRRRATCSTAVVGLDRRGDATRGAGLEPRLASLLRAVGGGARHARGAGRAPDQAQATLAALTELELLGRLRRVAGGRYVVVPRW